MKIFYGKRIMGAAFGAVSLLATLGMALGPWLGGVLFDRVGTYGWMFIGSAAIGLGAVVIAAAFRAPHPVGAPLRAPAARAT